MHEFGAISHYYGLIALAKAHNYDVTFYEFRLYSLLKRTIKGNFSIIRWVKNVLFLIRLPFIHPSKIVIGTAPFCPYLPLLMFLTKKHEVYHHTSYTYWDGVTAAHPTNSAKLKKQWKYFTSNYVRHIFTVSDKTKNEIVKYGYSTPERISVVNHAYNYPIQALENHVKNNIFIFVGRIVPEKGIHELLQIFASRSNAKLILIGKGSEESLVQEYSEKYPNIQYIGAIQGLKNIIPFYQSASFLIMNSQRMNAWEELFGIAIIEGMACGCVPITTDHSGPKEIITQGQDGILCSEKHISEGIDKAISMSNADYQTMRINTINTGKKYTADNIAMRWNAIFS